MQNFQYRNELRMCTNPVNTKLIYIHQLVCAQCTFDGGDLIHYRIVLSCGLVQQAKKMKLQNSKLFRPVGAGHEYEEWTGAG